MQQVVFRLLGPPEIRYKEQLIKIPRRRSRALLYYLACNQTPQPRERLLALLCGDTDEESARHTFKTSLAEVRALLRSFDPTIEWIMSDDDQLRLNPLAPLWLDTEIFEKGTAVTSRHLNRTLDLYRGDFLDGFFLRDAPGFETWMRTTRDHFRHIYLSTLRRLAELYEADNQLEPAITCLQMLLARDPLLEDDYVSLMRLYWMAGKRIEALRVYERLCEVLTQELAIRPSAATQALYEQIARRNRWSPASQASASSAPVPEAREPSPALPVTSEEAFPRTALSPFVGRTAELAWLRDHLKETAETGPLLLLTGEAGIGKTRLLQEALARSDASWLLLQGACQEIERTHPYHGVVEALRRGLTGAEVAQLNLPAAWREQLALLLPEVFEPPAATAEGAALQPLLVAQALAATLNQLARPRRPVLLALDDLHWADEATLALLGYLARSVKRGSVFLLATSCPLFEQGRLAPLRRSVARQNRLAELHLPPLSSEEVERLVSLSLADELPPRRVALAEWCSQRSEGNPFFALAWLEQARRVAGDARLLTTLSMPEPIVSLLSMQLDFLSQEALSFLTAAAFFDAPFDPVAVSLSIDLDKKACLAACRELLQKGLVVAAPPYEGGLYAFAHNSIKDILLATARPVQSYFLRRVSRSDRPPAAGR